MRIGELAERSGLSRDTLRFYEKLGLISAHEVLRSPNGYRRYSPAALLRLQRIQRLKAQGLNLEHIAGVFARGTAACIDLPDQLQTRIEAIDRQIAALQMQRQALRAAHVACSSACHDQNGLPSCLTLACSG